MKHEMLTRHCLLATTALLLVGGCTYYVPAKLDANRVGDTLRVALAGPGAARWDPQADSLIIECASCSEEAARQAEHFDYRNEAQYDVANSESLTLIFYSMGHRDTTTIPGTASETGTPPARLLRHRFRAEAEPTQAEVKAASEAKAAAAENAAAEAKTAAAEKALKKTTFLKVTAAEGVAIYKDKTKQQVLKILPQGSTIVLLAREGDLYSVSVDGEEGFVDAEAVQVQ